jgi:hypothetical protein
MANGIVIERSQHGTPCYAHINLRKHGEALRPFFQAQGVSLEREIKFTPKLQKAMWEADNGVGKIGDINNFWDD